MKERPDKVEKTDYQLNLKVEEKTRIYMLGGFQIAQGTRLIGAEAIRLRRARDLVKLLALAPDHRLHRDQALESLWPEKDPQKSARSLSQLLFNLRPLLSSLDSTLSIQYADEALVLTSQMGVWTDVEAFEQAAYRVQIKPDPAECQAALLLYRGELLPEDPYSDLFIRRREELREAHAFLLNQLASYHIDQKEYTQAIELLRQMIAIDPTNEEAQVRLMQVYTASGQRSLALKTYQEMVGVLEREYGVAPSLESQRAYRRLLEAGESKPDNPHLATRNNLPVELTSFIGREDDLKCIGESIRTHRLTTLTGAGGVGKTRLALKTAEGLPDGPFQEIYWIELAPVENPAMLIPSVSAELGIRGSVGEDPTGQIQARLRDQPTLLILDNAEHLLAAVARLVEALLKGCPALTILVTSRAPLSISGEATYRVPSMRLPDPGTLVQVEQANAFDGLRLFDERARLRYAAFQLTPVNIGAVSAICRRLDGIPLAIELAAARARVLTAEQIAARLDDVFGLLASRDIDVIPRHQTLRAAIAWSYQLLSGKERRLLQRASVFSGCFSLEAAEEVCSGAGIEKAEVLDLLEALVDQSLVSFDFQVHGVGYYRTLETVRQYAREELLKTEDEAILRDRHLAYFTRFADQGDTVKVTVQAVELTDQFYANLGNIRTALDWSLNGPVKLIEPNILNNSVVLGMRLSTDLYWFWTSRGLGMEALEWWFKLLEAEEAIRGSVPLDGERKIQRARVLRCMVQMSIYFEHPRLPYDQQVTFTEESIRLLSDEPGPRGRHELGLAMLFGLGTSQLSWFDLEMKSLEIFREEGDKVCVCTALLNAAIYSWCNGEFGAYKGLEDEIYDLAHQTRDLNLLGAAYNFKGDCAVMEGKYQQADMFYNEYERYTFLCKDRFNEFNLYGRKIFLRVAEGRYAEAFALGKSALALAKDFQDNKHMGWINGLMARCAWSMGDDTVARDFCRTGLALSQEPVGDPTIIADPLFISGRIALSENDLPQAASTLRKAFIQLNGCNPIPFELILDTAAILFTRQERAERAAVLFGRTEPTYQKVKAYLAPRERSEHEEGWRLASANTGEAIFEQALQRGSLMTREEAAAFALAGL